MSYHNYLVLDKAKILVDIGNHVSKEMWLDEVEVIKKLWSFREGHADYFDMASVAFKDMNLRDFAALSKGYETITSMASNSSYLFATAIGGLMKDPEKAEIVGEESIRIKRFKNYKILSLNGID